MSVQGGMSSKETWAPSGRPRELDQASGPRSTRLRTGHVELIEGCLTLRLQRPESAGIQKGNATCDWACDIKPGHCNFVLSIQLPFNVGANMASCTVIEANTSTRHDGSVSVYVDGQVFALAAERVDKIRHSIDSRPAYLHLRKNLDGRINGMPCHDHFSTEYQPHESLDHHLAHALGAFHCSPFDEAAVVVLDGMGPTETQDVFTSASLWEARRGDVPNLLERVEAPYPCCDSFGHFFSAITYYLGFGFYDAGHTMSLAAFGNPQPYSSVMTSLIRTNDSGLPITDHDFILYATAQRFPPDFDHLLPPARTAALSAKYTALLGPPRRPNEDLVPRHRDIAAAAQAQLEVVLGNLLRRLASRTTSRNLCYSGGVALNCKANASVFLASPFERVFIHPAPDDTGQSIGKLVHRLQRSLGAPCAWRCEDVFLGPEYSETEVESALAGVEDCISATQLTTSALVSRVAQEIIAGNVVGWFQGRSEFGPRALGHRSILANATDRGSVTRVSDRIKKREWYRPFAPSVLESAAQRYFEFPAQCERRSPFMQYALRASDVAVAALSAVIHVDKTARVQTVADGSGAYSSLLAELGKLNGHPVVLNTSFNTPGSPIVETPADALAAFLDSQLDCLVINNWYIVRNGGR